MARQGFIRDLGDVIRRSGFIVPLFHAIAVGAAICVIFWVQDFYTSYKGVSLMPTRTIPDTASDFERTLMLVVSPVAIALSPWAFATVSFYVILVMRPMSPVEKVLWGTMIGIFFVCLGYDITTGYAYYIDPSYATLVPFVSPELDTDPVARKAVMSALGRVVVIDTIFSEIMGTLCWGLLVDLWPDYQRKTGLLVKDKEDRDNILDSVVTPPDSRAREQMRPPSRAPQREPRRDVTTPLHRPETQEPGQ